MNPYANTVDSTYNIGTIGRHSKNIQIKYAPAIKKQNEQKPIYNLSVLLSTKKYCSKKYIASSINQLKTENQYR